MDWAALISWAMTAGGGFVLLGIWLRGGGMAQQVAAGHRLRPPLVFAHASLTSSSLLVWILYLALDVHELSWVAFDMVAIGFALGLVMFAIWLAQLRGGRDERSAERHFPPTIVAAHGVLATATVALVLLATLGVGT